MPAMLCANPYMSVGGLAHGCGQCAGCRYNARRVWVHRIMLEAAQYVDNAFVTLTYDDDHLPFGGTLVVDHYRDWLKRLRRRTEPLRLRFFLVGEYGDSSGRPHYHAALFNFRTCEYGRTRYSRTRQRCCDRCELVRETWGHGGVYLGELGEDSAGYMAGYVTKKMTSRFDPRLEGRYPEFGRMSLRPGIGGDAMWDVASALLQFELDEAMSDVPVALRHGRKELPLGNYLRRRLRRMIGKDECAPQVAIDEAQERMRDVRVRAKGSTDVPSVKGQLLADNLQVRRNFDARQKIYKRGKTL